MQDSEVERENVQNMTEMNLKVIKIRVYVSRIRDAF